MTEMHRRAYQLLDEWEQYKTLHYSTHTQFHRAMDIEIEKDVLSGLSRQLREILISNNESDLELLLTSFSIHLNLVKDQLTLEVLRTGLPEKR